MISGDGDRGLITCKPEVSAGERAGNPHPGAVTFVTTEHFTLHGERSRAVSGLGVRASMFLATVSGGLIALGLVATTARVGTAFYAFALILLPTHSRSSAS
jgi:hypothetical protein